MTTSIAKKSTTGSLPPAVPLAITPTFSPSTHTSDDSYIYQLSLVLVTATLSFLGRCWAKIDQRKTQPGVTSKRRDSESATDIDRTKNHDPAMKSERGAMDRGRNPPSGHSVHKTAGDTWRAPAGIPLRIQKKDFLSGLGEERRTPRTSRSLDHRSTSYLRGRHLHSPVLPHSKRVGRGLIPCRDRWPIVA